nr:hypothetical protein CFP56_69190 [Quercus suber]
MSGEVGKELGNNIRKFIEVDQRARQSDQARFMRIRVDLQLEKPLRRGGKIASVEGEKFWVNFRYERLPTFCFRCGRLGHDEKHYKEPPNQQNPKQYGDWIRAKGNVKMGVEESQSTSSGDRNEGSEDRYEGFTAAATKLSLASVSDGGDGLTGSTGDRKNLGSKNFECNEVNVGDRKQSVTPAHLDPMEQATVGVLDAHDLTKLSPSDFSRDVLGKLVTDDALSLVGQQAQIEKQDMEVNSPIKLSVDQMEKEGNLEVTG